ncbi:hypothetical protein [Streptomyces sp. NPDC088816]|uniref:hypothetical protein n=1 Tax=Streptomyces sp. NPDC088816 TaxID=3365906 RepID=UPI00380F9D4E
MVPPAESWDSGASEWTAQHREAYANDQGAPTSLVAVTACSNRSKSDQDPAEWLPPAAEVHCRYVAEWVGGRLPRPERDVRTCRIADGPSPAASGGGAAACPDSCCPRPSWPTVAAPPSHWCAPLPGSGTSRGRQLPPLPNPAGG